MTGSQKQIDWANQIKSKYDTGLNALLAIPMPTTPTEAQTKLINQLKAVSDVTDPSWWIDNRVALEQDNPRKIAQVVASLLNSGDLKLPMVAV
jgi:hypothetical protein